MKTKTVNFIVAILVFYAVCPDSYACEEYAKVFSWNYQNDKTVLVIKDGIEIKIIPPEIPEGGLIVCRDQINLDLYIDYKGTKLVIPIKSIKEKNNVADSGPLIYGPTDTGVSLLGQPGIKQ